MIDTQRCSKTDIIIRTQLLPAYFTGQVGEAPANFWNFKADDEVQIVYIVAIGVVLIVSLIGIFAGV